MNRPLGFAALLLASCPVLGQTQADALAWLNRLSAAAHQLNYSGTFVYQHGRQSETSRIIHMRDEEGEHEKLEALDGPQREIIRTNDQVVRYLSEQNTLIVEKRRVARPFPAWLPQSFANVTENYNVRSGGLQRVGGYESQLVILEPRDRFRYGHQLWADVQTGLLVKAVTYNERNETVDQYTFTQLTIGGPIDKTAFLPRNPEGKLVVREQLKEGAPAQDVSTSDWSVQLPPGFHKTREMMRTLPGRKERVHHLVFSDGLAAVSVFVEPAGTEPAQPGVSSQGAINVYSKALGSQRITVLGEVPQATVRQIANTLQLKTK